MNLDILKVLVVLMAIIAVNVKLRQISFSNYLIINAGLFLLLFASVLDFTDGIRSLDKVFILGRQASHHDVLEDQVGDIPGLALMILGFFREILRKQ